MKYVNKNFRDLMFVHLLKGNLVYFFILLYFSFYRISIARSTNFTKYILEKNMFEI